MRNPSQVTVGDVNPLITCSLCSGYLIDATTIVECLHSFCKSCIVEYLRHNANCPVCDVLVHRTKPLLNLREDKTLQDIVYKLVPGLLDREKVQRQEFLQMHPKEALTLPQDPAVRPKELRGQDEMISMSLEYEHDLAEGEIRQKRYLHCPASLPVRTLKKFLRAKFDIPSNALVEVFYEGQQINGCQTLRNVARMYQWTQSEPMRFSYCVSRRLIEEIPESEPDRNPRRDEVRLEPIEEEMPLNLSMSSCGSVNADERVSIGLLSSHQ